jgi:rhomboid protease GluP
MPLEGVLVLVSVFAATLYGKSRFPRGPLRVQWLTLAMLLGLVLAFAAQHARPDLLLAFRRDAAAVAGGQYYRLLTALWFQDQWLAGAAFNLAMLFLIGSVAERLVSRPVWLGLYLGVGLAIECLALRWEPIGAGNSIAYLGLAGFVLAGIPDRTGSAAAWPLRLIGLAAGAFLALRQDIHGAALMLGAAIGLIARAARGRIDARAQELPQ